VPTNFTGKVEIVAISDIGALGDREGKPVVHELSGSKDLDAWFSP
jgi:hypothetical protein